MKNIAAFVFVSAVFFTHMLPVLADCGGSHRPGTNFLAYTIEPQASATALSLLVDLRFQVNGGKTSIELVLPSQWHNQTELFRAITDLQAVSPGTHIQEGIASQQIQRKRVAFVAGHEVHLSYRVVADSQDNLDPTNYFRVILRPSFFQVTGNNFLIYPLLPIHDTLPISIEWKNLPVGWTISNTLGSGDTCQTATAELVKVANGLFVGGDFRILKVNLDGTSLHVAIRGAWPFKDDEFLHLAHHVMLEERSLWRGAKVPHYLITLIPTDDALASAAGTALEDSSALFIHRTSTLNFRVKNLLAHEMFHFWNPVKLGTVAKPKILTDWFSEGFTEYYARLLLLRAGLVTFNEYVDETNTAFYEYRASPSLNVPNQTLENSSSAGSDLEKIPYQRGRFLALYWNDKIRKLSHGKQSLDDAMLDLFKNATQTNQVINQGFLISHFNRYLGAEAAKDVENYIDLARPLPLSSTAMGPCANLEEVTMYSYDLGLDIDTLIKQRLVSDVKRDSEAFKNGLRDGQRVIARGQIAIGDTQHPVSITVRDQNGEKDVMYFPRGPGFQSPQFKVNLQKLDTQNGACFEWFKN